MVEQMTTMRRNPLEFFKPDLSFTNSLVAIRKPRDCCQDNPKMAFYTKICFEINRPFFALVAATQQQWQNKQQLQHQAKTLENFHLPKAHPSSHFQWRERSVVPQQQD
jgi:hypothetical protein